MNSGAVKGLCKDRSSEHLSRVLLMHFGCGRLLLETALRARWAELPDPSAAGLWKRLKNCKVLAKCSLRRVVQGARRSSGAVCVLRSQPGAPLRPGQSPGTETVAGTACSVHDAKPRDGADVEEPEEAWRRSGSRQPVFLRPARETTTARIGLEEPLQPEAAPAGCLSPLSAAQVPS